MLGVGHELRGDDAAGMMVARMLRPSTSDSFLIIEAGAAAENFTGMVRNFAPDFVLIVDAVLMNQSPGTIRLFDMGDLEVFSLTSHMLSCHLLALYLQTELRCEVKLLGIQVEHDSLETGLSPKVKQSISIIVQELRNISREY